MLRTDAGDVNLILFATQLAEDAPQQAAGFVRWIDPNSQGGLSLESVGPIAYAWPEGEEHQRFVHGVMTVNGQGQEPFVLEVNDAGAGKANEDTASILVGDRRRQHERLGVRLQREGHADRRRLPAPQRRGPDHAGDVRRRRVVRDAIR